MYIIYLGLFCDCICFGIILLISKYGIYFQNMLCSPVCLNDLRFHFASHYTLPFEVSKSLRLQTSNRLGSNLVLSRNKALEVGRSAS